MLQLQIDQSQSSNPELIKNPDYLKIQDILSDLARTGILHAAPGNCVAISEMVQHLLWDQGLKSRLVECRLMTTRPTGDRGLDWTFVGYNGQTQRGQIDTHVILLVDIQSQTLLLDLSTQHLLPGGRLWLCESLGQKGEPDYLGHYDLDGYKFLYTIKKNPRLPELHQKGLVERIEQEREQRRTINSLKWILAAVAVFTLINFTLNTIMLWLRVVPV